MAKDYYKTLGVEKNASKDEIKKAFHKLAHKHHPDKNKGDDSKFKEINEAYQVLSDDKKRASYDQFGNADGPQGFGGGQGNPFSGFGGFGGQGGVEFDMGDLGDIFGDFFGGGMGRSSRGVPKGRDMETEIVITFEESVFGVHKTISMTKQSTCDICKGSGGKPGSKMDTCKTCGGQGKVRQVQRSILGNFESVRTCTACHGNGKIPSEKCTECKGAGVRRKDEKIDIAVPAGINNGESLRMVGMGEAVQGGQAGDLYIRIAVKPHTIYKRDGLNLMTDIHIKLSEALLGKTYTLKILEGNTVEVKIPEGTNHLSLLRVKGKGVPSSRGRGDIILRVHIDMPHKLSKVAKEAIGKLKEEGL